MCRDQHHQVPLGTITGTTEIWAETNNRDFKVGSFFDQAQARAAARVVVLGPTVASTLLGDSAAALGQTVRISHVPFRVIGVMQPATAGSWTTPRSCR